jgi:hypothetical protein
MTKDDRPRCETCHRPLRSAESIKAGRGRVCQARKDRQDRLDAVIAAAEGVIPAPALAKAVAAIRSGAIRHRIYDLYAAESSDRTHVYDVNPRAGSCTCAAGSHGRHCYHYYGAALMAAA